MSWVGQTELRAAFARRLSTMYGGEVPAYTTLVEVAHEVNAEVLAREGSAAERLGSIDRVSAERHGAIRVGGPAELAQVGRLFAAMCMHRGGFYDLRDAQPAPRPIVSTACRPTDPVELARNPFRVFTSVLVPEDRRFFDAALQARVQAFVAARTLFPPALLELADRAAAGGGLRTEEADRFLDLATVAFALSPDPIDKPWYD
ncbi:MAG: 2-oxoadipate dioxygenase/decarboxylase family protein, partial [Nocardioides sp.]